jgi:hypothetical protein
MEASWAQAKKLVKIAKTIKYREIKILFMRNGLKVKFYWAEFMKNFDKVAHDTRDSQCPK